MISQFAYFLGCKGKLYIATDVKELFTWMEGKLLKSKHFTKIKDIDGDLLRCMTERTEESMKVHRKGESVYYAAFERVSNTIL